jgi:hypothetical protein
MRSVGRLGVLLAALAGVNAFAGPPPELEPLAFLIGQWDASGRGEPGTGSGTAVFTRGLQDRVILRTSYAEYPASAGKLGWRHDDLLVLYAVSGALRADYYDSEGHVIRYVVQSPAAGQAVFLSEAGGGQPRFRLRYTLQGSGVLAGEFAVAPPDAPEAFKPYLTWESRKSTIVTK